MGKYGEAAEIATKLLISNKVSSPVDAWELAVTEVFPNSESSRKKGCPRNTFLGMCEEGLVIGAKSGSYTRSKKNKGYALKALSLLTTNIDFISDKNSLWKLVIEGQNKRQNSQMDIVVTMWEKGLINLKML